MEAIYECLHAQINGACGQELVSLTTNTWRSCAENDIAPILYLCYTAAIIFSFLQGELPSCLCPGGECALSGCRIPGSFCRAKKWLLLSSAIFCRIGDSVFWQKVPEAGASESPVRNRTLGQSAVNDRHTCQRVLPRPIKRWPSREAFSQPLCHCAVYTDKKSVHSVSFFHLPMWTYAWSCGPIPHHLSAIYNS